jgi:hypothetical protein
VDLNTEEIFSEWEKFCSVLQTLVLERFHFRTLDSEGLLDFVSWWQSRWDTMLPALQQYFATTRYPYIYSVEDICTAVDVDSYWAKFGFKLQSHRPGSSRSEFSSTTGRMRPKDVENVLKNLFSSEIEPETGIWCETQVGSPELVAESLRQDFNEGE